MYIYSYDSLHIAERGVRVNEIIQPSIYTVATHELLINKVSVIYFSTGSEPYERRYCNNDYNYCLETEYCSARFPSEVN